MSKYLKDVEAIQESAVLMGAFTGVVKELTYQQGLSILLRHRQLVQEGINYSNTLTPEEKAEQIEKCYEQRAKRRARR